MLFIMRLHSFVEFFLSERLTKASLIDFLMRWHFALKTKMVVLGNITAHNRCIANMRADITQLQL